MASVRIVDRQTGFQIGQTVRIRNQHTAATKHMNGWQGVILAIDEMTGGYRIKLQDGSVRYVANCKVARA